MREFDFADTAILIVDDEADLREVIVDEFTAHTQPVYAAASAEEALAILTGFSVRIVITDIRMPGMNGIELLRTIKAQFGRSVEVILISGYSDYSENDALNAGAAALFHKPFNFNDLLALVEQLARKTDNT